MAVISSEIDTMSFARECLGFSINPTSQYQNTKDAVIVSIDFENVKKLMENPYTPSLKTQMGVCILDTKLIGHKSADEILQTHNFSTGRWQERDEDFLFGETQYIPQVRQLMSELNKLINRKRNIVFLAHDNRAELAILAKLGFDLKIGISAFLDTQQLSDQIYCGNNIGLESLITELGIDARMLHVGGNDANYTMKAFLLLATDMLKHVELDDATNTKVQYLTAIAKTKLSSLDDGNKEIMQLRKELWKLQHEIKRDDMRQTSSKRAYQSRHTQPQQVQPLPPATWNPYSYLQANTCMTKIPYGVMNMSINTSVYQPMAHPMMQQYLYQTYV